MLEHRCASRWIVPFFLAACSGTNPGQDPEPVAPRWLEGGTAIQLRLSERGSVAERSVAVTPLEAWRVLPEVYRAIGLGGQVLDTDAWQWGNPNVTARRLAGTRADRLFRCANEGAGPSAVSRFRLQFSIITTVSEGGDGQALLHTAVEATGSQWEGTSTQSVLCISRGMLEMAIERGVLERAGSAAREAPAGRLLSPRVTQSGF